MYLPGVGSSTPFLKYMTLQDEVQKQLCGVNFDACQPPFEFKWCDRARYFHPGTQNSDPNDEYWWIEPRVGLVVESVLRCEGIEDVAPQLRCVGSDNVYEPYECLIDRTNTWLRDQTDVSVVNLQSILVQKDLTGQLDAQQPAMCKILTHFKLYISVQPASRPHSFFIRHHHNSTSLIFLS